MLLKSSLLCIDPQQVLLNFKYNLYLIMQLLGNGINDLLIHS